MSWVDSSSLISNSFSATDSYETMKAKRATLKETYDFINGLLEDVMTNYVDIFRSGGLQFRHLYGGGMVIW